MSDYDHELSKIVEELNRAAPSQQRAAVPTGQLAGHPAKIAAPPGSTASLEQLLAFAASRGASDVLLVPGAPAVLRINGALAVGSGPALEPDDVRSLALPLLEPGQLEELQK